MLAYRLMDWNALFADKILNRGLNYYKHGCIASFERNEQKIRANVTGSEIYTVSISLSDGGVSNMDCSCPHATSGNNCKHMAAALFYAENHPSRTTNNTDQPSNTRDEAHTTFSIQTLPEPVISNTAVQTAQGRDEAFDEQKGCTLVLHADVHEQTQYKETPLYGKNQKQQQIGDANSKTEKKAKVQKKKQAVPEQIRKMQALYQERFLLSFELRYKNFYIQGKFMEDYEDNAPWYGDLYSYGFMTYHDLSIKQLRGYFTWRTELRKGNFQKHCEVFVFIYLLELLNGIGAVSAEDSLRKIQEFERAYIDAGLGGQTLQRRLHEWTLEFAVVNNIEPATARLYIAQELLEEDAEIEILRHPKKYSDADVFKALCKFGKKKTAESTVIQLYGAEAVRLFAAVFRLVSAQYRENGQTLFRLCFGIRRSALWYPFDSVCFYNKEIKEAFTYELTSCRSYIFKNEEWYIRSYQKYYFQKQRLVDLLHETDRRLRLYLKTKHPLKERKEAAWAVPYIEAVIEADRKAKIEAARQKITIDFSGLNKIRQDALKTQSSLLTEEEKLGAADSAVISVKQKESPTTIAQDDTGAAEKATTQSQLNLLDNHEECQQAMKGAQSLPLNSMQTQLMQMLLCGEPVQELITAQHGMASVIADAINEALFDFIGDTVVECDGEAITLVEDYREDIINILKEE